MNNRNYAEMESVDTDALISEFDAINFELSRRKIVPFNGSKDVPSVNIIKIYIDRSCSMASVLINDDYMMTGNFHDFHPGCHGGALRVLGNIMNQPDWSGCTSLAVLIQAYIKKCTHYSNNWMEIHSDTTAEIVKYTGKYNNDEWTDIVKQ